MMVRTQPANTIVRYALTGGDAHVATRSVFDGLNWRVAGARVEASPHTLYELLNHMIFWQEGVLEWLKGNSPKMPEHAADSWPAPQCPAAVQNFRRPSAAIRLDSRDWSVPRDEPFPPARAGARARWKCSRRSAPTTATTLGK